MKKVNLCKFTIIINESNVILFIAKRIEGRPPHIGVDKI
jgi:hypothetical protein